MALVVGWADEQTDKRAGKGRVTLHIPGAFIYVDYSWVKLL